MAQDTTPKKTAAAKPDETDAKPENQVAATARPGSTTSDLGTPDAQTAVIPPSEGIQTTADAIDPRTGEQFGGNLDHVGGRYGFPDDEGPAGTVPRYDPARLPVEVTSHVMPEAADGLWAAVRVAAPNLTPEIAEKFGLTDDDLARIARREVPPPPTNGPIRSSDLYLTPAGPLNVPAGVDPAAIGQNKIGR